MYGVEVTYSHFKQITARSPHLQSQFKSKACPIVATSFGFQSSTTEIARAENRDLVVKLKTDKVFTFHISPSCARASCEKYAEWDAKVHGASIDEHKGLYKHPLLQLLINDVLFKHKNDIAVQWPKYFKPFPCVAFAMVLTAVGPSFT